MLESHKAKAVLFFAFSAALESKLSGIEY